MICASGRRSAIHSSGLSFGQGLVSSSLTELHARYEADLPANFNLAADGPLIIVSNHPSAYLTRGAGRFHLHLPPICAVHDEFPPGRHGGNAPWIIAVDPFNADSSAQRNMGPMKEALRFVKKGGALAIFPSGEVAHYKMGRGIEESPWSNHVGALVRRTQATVLPVYFPGHNGMLFQTAGLVHPMLRTGLLLRELFQRSKEPVEIRVGQPIPSAG